MTDYVPASCKTCKGLGVHRDPSQVNDPTADEPCAACAGTGDRLPSRLVRLLAYAERLGLRVEYRPGDGSISTRGWTLSGAYGDALVFVYWTPGPRGGAVGARIYRPHAKPRSRLNRCESLADARSWMRAIAPLRIAELEAIEKEKED